MEEVVEALMEGQALLAQQDWPRTGQVGKERANEEEKTFCKLQSALEGVAELLKTNIDETLRQTFSSACLCASDLARDVNAKKVFASKSLEWEPNCCQAMVALAEHEIRHTGDVVQAQNLLEKAIGLQPIFETLMENNHEKSDEEGDEEEEQEDSSTQWASLQLASIDSAKYTLALILLASGAFDRADERITQLGFKYRLHDQAFSRTKSDLQEKWQAFHPNHEDSPLVVLDNCFPSEFTTFLRSSVFAAQSRYWADHDYHNPKCQYFSYGFDLRDEPRSSVEAFIKDHLFPVVKASSPKASKGATRAEWWVHNRDLMSGHQLHWDSDEARLNRGDGLFCPIVSTVVYLEAGASCAPTLVTTQKFGQDAAQDGWLVFPKQDRLVIFDGQLLHGVVPQIRGTSCPSQGRLTLMVGFWDDSVVQRAFDPVRLGANMVFSETSKEIPPWFQDNSSPFRSWPSFGTTINDFSSCQQLNIDDHAIHPIWCPVKPSQTEDDKQDIEEEEEEEEEDGTFFVGKYFLRSLEDLQQDVQELVNPPAELLSIMLEQLEEEEEQGDEAKTKDTIQFIINVVMRCWKEAKTEEENEVSEERAQVLISLLSTFSETAPQLFFHANPANTTCLAAKVQQDNIVAIALGQVLLRSPCSNNDQCEILAAAFDDKVAHLFPQHSLKDLTEGFARLKDENKDSMVLLLATGLASAPRKSHVFPAQALFRVLCLSAENLQQAIDRQFDTYEGLEIDLDACCTAIREQMSSETRFRTLVEQEFPHLSTKLRTKKRRM